MTLADYLIGRLTRLCAGGPFDFARHTTIGCGGTAAAWACPKSGEELASLLALLKEQNIPSCFLGAGANVLPRDGVFDGVVIRFSGFCSLAAEGAWVRVGAGVTGGRLLRFAKEKCLAGAEFLTGIPMTVGGAVAMNAGVKEGHIGELISRVFCASAGRTFCLSQAECAFQEKDSIFLRENIAVIGAELKLKHSFPEEIARRRCYFRTKRRALPKGRSMGCVFVNPEGKSAGAVIEACGLKGMRLGGARVSDVHANFILNDGGTASEVSALIALVKERVREETGIVLREEVRRLP